MERDRYIESCLTFTEEDREAVRRFIHEMGWNAHDEHDYAGARETHPEWFDHGGEG